MAKLGDVFTLIRNGASIKQTEGAGGFPITRIETIANRKVDHKKFGYADIVDITKYESYVLQDGDILMSHINSEKHLGKVALYKKQVNEQIIHGMNLLVLRANPKILLSDYAAYFFETPGFLRQIQKITKKSVNQASFTVTALKELEIPLPSLDEQRRIAAVLDKVTDLIAQRRAQLDKLDLLVKSRFVEMFGDPEYNNKNWEIVPLSTVCSVGSSKRIYQNEQSTQGIPFLRISDLMNLINTGILTTNLYIPEKRYKELQLKGQVPKSGDILVTSRGTLGQCYIIKDYDKFYFQDGMISWLSAFKDNITPLYLSYLFAMPGFHKQIDAMQAGSTVSYLSISMIKKLKVMIPDIKKQQDFAKFITEKSSLKSILTQSLTQLQTLKKTIMQEHFAQGEAIV